MASPVWAEDEIEEIVRSRSCNSGVEYYIKWKNGERSTWELRDSFFTQQLMDDFDKKTLKNATEFAPIFNAEQDFLRNKLSRRHKSSRSSKSIVSSKPKNIRGCVEINGLKFALVKFRGNPTLQLIRWDIFKVDFPDLAQKFIDSRLLHRILSC